MGGFVETSAQHVTTADSTKVLRWRRREKLAFGCSTVDYAIQAAGGDETPASVIASLAVSKPSDHRDEDISLNSALTSAAREP